MNTNKKEGQSKQVLRHLLTNKRISAMDALRRYGIMRLAARIYELRDQGIDIITMKSGTGYGSYAIYEIIDSKTVKERAEKILTQKR